MPPELLDEAISRPTGALTVSFEPAVHVQHNDFVPSLYFTSELVSVPEETVHSGGTVPSSNE